MLAALLLTTGKGDRGSQHNGTERIKIWAQKYLPFSKVFVLEILSWGKEPMMRRQRLRHLLLLIYLQQPIELPHCVAGPASVLLQISAQLPFPGLV